MKICIYIYNNSVRNLWGQSRICDACLEFRGGRMTD